MECMYVFTIGCYIVHVCPFYRTYMYYVYLHRRYTVYSTCTLNIQNYNVHYICIFMYALYMLYLLQWTLARTYFKEASDLMDYEKKRVKTMWGQFWAAHQVRMNIG